MPTVLWLCGIMIALGGAVVATPRIWSGCIQISKFFVTINILAPALAVYAKELQKNGGTSIKDKVDKTALRVEQIATKMDEAARKVDDVFAAKARQDGVLEAQNVVLAATQKDVAELKKTVAEALASQTPKIQT